MAIALGFKSEDDKNPWIVFTDELVCLEENSDQTITFWVKRITQEIKCAKTKSTFADPGNYVKNFTTEFPDKVVKINNSDSRVIYIHKDYLKTDVDSNLILLSGEVLINAQTEPA